MDTGIDTLRTLWLLSNYKAWRILRNRIANLLHSAIQSVIAKSIGNSGLVVLRGYVNLIRASTLALILAATPHIAAADSQLIMVTSDYCPYCQAWERDIGVVYHKSPYAPSLPLTRVYVESKLPEDMTFQRPVIGTPTFLIIHDGKEIDRQRGYIDAEMFWWWLSEHKTK